MKHLLLAATLFTSLISLSFGSSADMERAYAKGELETVLWSCDTEDALKELLDSRNIQSNIGCANAIAKAKKVLEVSEIAAIMDKVIVQAKQIQAFEAQVRSVMGSGREVVAQLVPSVEALKENEIGLHELRRISSLNEDEMYIVELSFKSSRTELERALEDF